MSSSQHTRHGVRHHKAQKDLTSSVLLLIYNTVQHGLLSIAFTMKLLNVTYITWSISVLFLVYAHVSEEMTKSKDVTDCIMDKYLVGECMRAENSTLRMWTNQDDVQAMWLEITAFDPAIHCSKIEMENFEYAYACVSHHMLRCLDFAGMAGIQPNTSSMMEGYKSLCEKQKDFDAECFKVQFPKVIQCGQLVTDTYIIGKMLTVSNIICIFNDAIYDCAKHLLKTCSKCTRDLYMQQLDNHLLPTECNFKKPSRPKRLIFQPMTSGMKGNHSATDLFVFVHILYIVLSFN